MKSFKTILLTTFISLVFSSCSLHLLETLDNNNNGNSNSNNNNNSNSNTNSNNNNSSIKWITSVAVGNSTLGDDECLSVAVDDNANVYCAGSTSGDLGEPNGGGTDAFVMKVDSGGVIQWITQLGATTASTLGIDTSQNDYCNGVIADQLGNVYCAGNTVGALGEAQGGVSDAFVMKLNSSGVIQWIRQLGDVTKASIPGHDTSKEDSCNGVAVDGPNGNVYCAGYTFGSLREPFSGWGDAFIMKLNSSGVPQWIRQLGTSTSVPGGDTTQRDYCQGVTVGPDGAVYCAGYTAGSLGEANGGGYDAFVIKLDNSGNPQWITQLGSGAVGAAVPGGNTTQNDSCEGVATDGSNVYCAGYTLGALGEANGGGSDAFAIKLDDHGAVQWITQFGAVTTVAGGSNSGNDYCNAVATDGTSVYCAGYTYGNMGELNGGNFDAFVTKLDGTLGVPQWLTQLGAITSVQWWGDSLGNDTCKGVATDGTNAYCAGWVDHNTSDIEAFVMKL